MDELHAAIAVFLRSQRPAAAWPMSEPPVPSVRRQRVSSCRFCAARIWEVEHGESFHFDELWAAVSCEACHRDRLLLESQPGTLGSLLRQGSYKASTVSPRCKQCGQVIGDGGDRYPVEKLRAKRVCAACYNPF